MGNETQTIMIVRNGKVYRLPGQIGLPLLYVDHISAAPWNILPFVTTPHYKSCGKRMIQAAIRYSLSLGFDGRIGLHSLGGAEGFYRNALRMRDCGIDTGYEDLRYFEITEDTAKQIAQES